MKTKAVTGQIKQKDFNRFIAAYPNLDAASRLCADYCITTEEFSTLTQEIRRKEEKPSRTSTRRSSRSAFLITDVQSRGRVQREGGRGGERLKNDKRKNKGWWKRLTSTLKSFLDRQSNPKPPPAGLA